MSQRETTSQTASTRPRVMLLAEGGRADIRSEVDRLRPLIERHVDVVHCDLEFESGMADVDAEFALVLGGDGSILRTAKLMAYRQRPVIGVNLGRLGFLADLQPDQLDQAEQALIDAFGPIANERNVVRARIGEPIHA